MSSLSTAQTILSIAQDCTIYISFIILIGGLLGNTCIIITILRLKFFRKNSSSFYLISESIANSIILIIPYSFRIGINGFNYDPSQTSIVWCKLRQTFGQMCILISMSLVCFAAIDQYLSTNHRPYLRPMSSLKLAQYLTACAIFIWILHSIPFIVFLAIQQSNGCNLYNNVLINYITYIYYPILCGMLPIVISSLFSLLAFTNVRQIVRRQMPVFRRRLDRQMTSMILIRVIFLIIFTLPNTIQRIYTLIVPADPNDLIGAALEQLVGVITISLFYCHVSCSFYIFIISSRRFRRQVKYVFFKKCWKPNRKRTACVYPAAVGSCVLSNELN
ncbi:unnamed protein product [Adineta steineri]|uniref:G-protein coupled receptors family 1 profile domain-containing protein n=1 Tax=Adineta steineri TaxID=433720 RepID=A0A814JY78_9BILA|nr:unnamed protein product [Adineta steineri]CAF3814495.1 unnamed protein product [Adineta steineri]